MRVSERDQNEDETVCVMRQLIQATAPPPRALVVEKVLHVLGQLLEDGSAIGRRCKRPAAKQGPQKHAARDVEAN